MTAPAPGYALPAGIHSRTIGGINGLDMHVLEAGRKGDPCVLLLHGFPELAYSWRKVMLPLADAGYHVVAPDQRGYGRTTGWDGRYDGDLASFRMLNLARDALGLVYALDCKSVACVAGHDFGSPVAAWCSLVRPDVFRSVALMSSPFAGPTALPAGDSRPVPHDPVHDDLAALPVPRKHYQWYYSTREADLDMRSCKQGLHAFLRAYYHAKSADWPHNPPHPLTAWSAGELAKLPRYYVMDLDRDMAQTVAPEMPAHAAVDACAWLTEAELAVYSAEYARTGFQGALQWYRCRTSGLFNAEQQLFSGRTIDVPAVFMAGARDWGPYQKAGELEKMRTTTCTRFRSCQFIEGAGHWVQQEQPAEVSRQLLGFVAGAARSG